MAENSNLSQADQLSERPAVRSNDFRYIPCDSVAIAMSEDSAKIIMGVDEVDGSITQLVGVHLSLKTANSLRFLLQRGLQQVEEETGVTFEEPDIGVKNHD